MNTPALAEQMISPELRDMGRPVREELPIDYALAAVGHPFIWNRWSIDEGRPSRGN